MDKIDAAGTSHYPEPGGADAWRVDRLQRAARPQAGFAGPGHIATQVVGSDALDLSDPFVLLMDDALTFSPDRPVGQSHPHAGIATATLVLEGTLIDRDEGVMRAGDVVWMIAGKGVVHNESVRVGGYARVLQLWLGLPEILRRQAPALQRLDASSAGVQEDVGNGSRRYKAPISAGGHDFGELHIANLKLLPGEVIEAAFPRGDSLLLYVLDGSLQLQDHRLVAGDVAWLKHASILPDELLRLSAGAGGLRAIVFSAPRVGEALVHHGPFVAGSTKELASYYASFAKGEFPSIGDIYVPPGTSDPSA